MQGLTGKRVDELVQHGLPGEQHPLPRRPRHIRPGPQRAGYQTGHEQGGLPLNAHLVRPLGNPLLVPSTVKRLKPFPAWQRVAPGPDQPASELPKTSALQRPNGGWDGRPLAASCRDTPDGSGVVVVDGRRTCRLPW